MNQGYLSFKELEKFLDVLGMGFGLYKIKELEALMLEAYGNDENESFKKHSYSDIAEYVLKKDDLDTVLFNINYFLDYPDEVKDKELLDIAHKLRDHIRLEAPRVGLRNQMLQSIDLVNSDRTSVQILKEDVEEILEQNKNNLSKIKEIQETILKEVIAVASILITIIGLLLTNVSIIPTIRDNEFINSGSNIFALLIQINSTMIIGISALMIIASSFIHKSADKEFWKSTKFLVPFLIGIIAFIAICLSLLLP